MSHSVTIISSMLVTTTAISRNGFSYFRLFIPLSLLIALSAGCSGGGGGGGGDGTSGNISPTAQNTCQPTPTNNNLMGDLNNFVSDPDNSMFGFTLISDGSKGTTQINPDGTFTYSPNLDERGFDSFIYMVDDLNGGTNTAVFQILIGRTRIMPVGDSITEGITLNVMNNPNLPPVNERVGYRRKLYDDLNANGFFIDFVGSTSNGAAAIPPIADPQHHGYGGARDDQILVGNAPVPTAIGTQLNATPADIILLHIGTNNINGNAGANNGTDPLGAQEVEMILDAIDIWEANNNPVTVFLARIIERATQGGMLPNPNIQTFNNNIQTMALGCINDNIFIVNQQDALVYPGDLNDGIHPSQSGYDKMADTWLQALQNSGILPVCSP